MNLEKLLNWNYLFQAYTTEPLSNLTRVLLYGFCALAIVAAVLAQRQLAKNPGVKKVLFKKIVASAWTLAMVGLLLLFFRESLALYLGARLWLLLWLLTAIIWIAYLLVYYFKTIPQLKKQHEDNKEFNKWLPKSKK